MDLGPMEIGLILVIILIIFGAGKLPEVGGALGKAIREFKREKDGLAENTKVSPAANNTGNAATAQTVEVKANTEKKS